ncbi:11312_t:CDS:2, partial [Ambispora leptoticha]
ISLAHSTQARIKQATTLESLLQERNKLIQNYHHQELTQQKTTLLRHQQQERWVWGGLLAALAIIAIGDIFGKTGRKVIHEYLPELKKEQEIDLTIAN